MPTFGNDNGNVQKTKDQLYIILQKKLNIFINDFKFNKSSLIKSSTLYGLTIKIAFNFNSIKSKLYCLEKWKRQSIINFEYTQRVNWIKAGSCLIEGNHPAIQRWIQVVKTSKGGQYSLIKLMRSKNIFCKLKIINAYWPKLTVLNWKWKFGKIKKILSKFLF